MFYPRSRCCALHFFRETEDCWIKFLELAKFCVVVCCAWWPLPCSRHLSCPLVEPMLANFLWLFLERMLAVFSALEDTHIIFIVCCRSGRKGSTLREIINRMGYSCFTYFQGDASSQWQFPPWNLIHSLTPRTLAPLTWNDTIRRSEVFHRNSFTY